MYSDLKNKQNYSRTIRTLGENKNKTIKYENPYWIKSRLTIPSCIQKIGPPSTKERTRNAHLYNRHMIPHPFWDLGSWYKTLMETRVASLYLTQAGFIGHAYQIQQELNRLIELIDNDFFSDRTSFQTAIEYEEKIKRFIISQAIHDVNYDIPKFVFSFSGNKTITIERQKGKYIGTT